MKSAFSIQIVVGVSRCENNHRFVDDELDGAGKGRDMSLHFAVSDREVRSLTAEQMEQQIQPQQIRLVKDPVFKKDKNFSCFPIAEVLRAGFGPIWQQALKDDDNGESIIVRMTAVDGHTGYLPISKITQPGGCLVYKDNDTNGPWERTGREMEPSAEPYYFRLDTAEQQKTRYLPAHSASDFDFAGAI
jgi:hypothetical protein